MRTRMTTETDITFSRRPQMLPRAVGPAVNPTKRTVAAISTSYGWQNITVSRAQFEHYTDTEMSVQPTQTDG